MNQNTASESQLDRANSISKDKNRSGCLKTMAIVFGTAVVSVALTFWVLTTYIFPANFTPVQLSQAEKTTLDTKLAAFDGWQSTATQSAKDDDSLEPEEYSEQDTDRVIALSERELNGIIARNSDIAHRLVIDLSEDLASAKLLVPLDDDFPVMGGRNLKLSAGLELAYASERAVVVLKGVSVMGVPIPGAWLGGLKNVDLVEEFGDDAGFWQAFSQGVDYIRIEQGKLVIKLKE